MESLMCCLFYMITKYNDHIVDVVLILKMP